MTTRTIGRGTVRAAAELAGRAPSLHNTQPWRLRWDGPTVRIDADRARQLPGTDPDGRGLLLSCGAALHHLRVALAALDVGTVVERFPDHTDIDHVATVFLYPGAADAGLAELAGAISGRHTDRRRFADRPISDTDIDALRVAVSGAGATLVSLPSAHAHHELISAMGRASRMAARDPESTSEAELWSGAFAEDDGVPSSALPRDPAGVLGGVRFPTGSLDQPSDPSDGAALLLVVTHTDDPHSRVRAGEATSAALLRATTLGLASAPLSQVLEYPATRMAVAERVLVDTDAHPQMVLRVGWPRAATPTLLSTPRRPVDDYLDDVRAGHRGA
ncbi:Acg family FMN-binding oxidoreductase [Pseudonocardia sp. CA-107938]|uniref:Acg family FMN-binding oxidoreductase n=1 Tax=Pseudonocardia sp. CA-107938 TaxID=3240021 RepID=UPI003D9204D7